MYVVAYGRRIHSFSWVQDKWHKCQSYKDTQTHKYTIQFLPSMDPCALDLLHPCCSLDFHHPSIRTVQVQHYKSDFGFYLSYACITYIYRLGWKLSSQVSELHRSCMGSGRQLERWKMIPQDSNIGKQHWALCSLNLWLSFWLSREPA